MELKTGALEILVFAAQSLSLPSSYWVVSLLSSPSIPRQSSTAEYGLVYYDLHTHYMPYPKLHIREMLNTLVRLWILCFKNSVHFWVFGCVGEAVCLQADLCIYTSHTRMDHMQGIAYRPLFWHCPVQILVCKCWMAFLGQCCIGRTNLFSCNILSTEVYNLCCGVM